MTAVNTSSPLDVLDRQGVILTNEAAAVARVSSTTLLKMVEAGLFPRPLPRLPRSPMRWSAAAVKAWLKQQAEGAASA